MPKLRATACIFASAAIAMTLSVGAALAEDHPSTRTSPPARPRPRRASASCTTSASRSKPHLKRDSPPFKGGLPRGGGECGAPAATRWHASSPRCEFTAGLHHVYARGVRRQPIYVDDRDRWRYLGLLDRVTRRMQWRCLSYCLMGNHMHLLIETREPNLGAGMHRLHGAYAQYFNRRYDHSGHLFKDRYDAVPIQNDRSSGSPRRTSRAIPSRRASAAPRATGGGEATPRSNTTSHPAGSTSPASSRTSAPAAATAARATSTWSRRSRPNLKRDSPPLGGRCRPRGCDAAAAQKKGPPLPGQGRALERRRTTKG